MTALHHGIRVTDEPAPQAERIEVAFGEGDTGRLPEGDAPETVVTTTQAHPDAGAPGVRNDQSDHVVEGLA